MRFSSRYFSLEPELSEAIAKKFNVDTKELLHLGGGGYGDVFEIDERSVFKITRSEEEAEAVPIFIEERLTLQLGYVTILPDDYLYFQHLFIYRREKLLPLQDAVGFPSYKIDRKTYNEIDRDIERFNQINRRLSSDLARSGPEDRELMANIFLQEARKYLEKPLFSAIVLFFYEAALKGISMWDLRTINVGFRYKEDGKTPAIEAGLVFFDPMAEIY